LAETVFTLGAALLNLHHTDPDGLITGDPIWFGLCAEGLKLTHRVQEKRFHPTGRPYPRTHHVGEEHTIQIDRIWLVDVGGDEAWGIERERRYVLEILWNHPDGRSDIAHRRTYYGVTIQSHDLTSENVHEFAENQQFAAEYFLADTPS
jgi:hypothetical protein